MSVPQKIIDMTQGYIAKAKDFVEGYQYMKVKKLSEGIGVTRSIAGCCFVAMKWNPINPNPSKANKTYENPNFKKKVIA